MPMTQQSIYEPLFVFNAADGTTTPWLATEWTSSEDGTSVTFTLREFCDACGVRRQMIIEMVEEGVIEPALSSDAEWKFHGHTLVRAQRALRLVRDLDINWPGAALVRTINVPSVRAEGENNEGGRA